jgi:hypothetical protein
MELRGRVADPNTVKQRFPPTRGWNLGLSLSCGFAVSLSPKALLLAPDDQRNLSFRRMCYVVRQDFARRTAPILFKMFCQFSRDTDFSSWISLTQNFERSNQAMGRFEVNRCTIAVQRGLKLALALTALDRQETAKEKTIGSKSRTDKGSEHSGRPRDNFEHEIVFDAGAYQSIAGI